MSSGKDLLQTLQHLKKSAGKLQKETPALNRQDMIEALTAKSFNKEFGACLKEGMQFTKEER